MCDIEEIYIYIYIYIYTHSIMSQGLTLSKPCPMGRAKKLNEGRKMRINVYDSEFHALQSSGTQFLLPKNKRQKY